MLEKAVDFTLTEKFKAYMTPLISSAVFVGQEIEFLIRLVNEGDLGAEVKGVIVKNTLPAELMPIISFIPIGYESGLSEYTDYSNDNMQGRWDGNTLIFDLSSYSGGEYHIKFKAKVSNAAMPGVRITSISTLYVLDVLRNRARATFPVRTIPYGSIEGFVWNDLDRSGIYTDDEKFIDNTTVELYDDNKLLLQTKITKSIDGQSGKYNFNMLIPGNYYIKFIPNDGYNLTNPKKDIENGSTPNPSSGFTDLLLVSPDEALKNINAGVFVKRHYQAINNLIESVALEELAISHILNAEGEKLQKVISMNASSEEILKVNKSVDSMLSSLTALESILSSKLNFVLEK